MKGSKIIMLSLKTLIVLAYLFLMLFFLSGAFAIPVYSVHAEVLRNSLLMRAFWTTVIAAVIWFAGLPRLKKILK